MEKRAHPRYDVPGAHIRTGGSSVLHACGLINGQADRRDLLDLGRGGMAFLSPFMPPEQGAHISADLYVAEGVPPHLVRGNIVWAENVGNSPPPDAASIWGQSSPFSSYRVGVKFNSVPEALAATIAQLGSVEGAAQA